VPVRQLETFELMPKVRPRRCQNEGNDYTRSGL